MFYSETLLQKTGPLAKVWLAANVERKLTKGDCLKQNITKDVRNIVSDDQAPLALRLTSQLLLGVVRIYSRKARYLLDDCNEALIKIKLAFRPGNVDLPSTQSHIANPAAINLQETITELDLFAPIPDLDAILGLTGGDQSELDWGTSQVLPDSVEESQSQSASQAFNLEDDDLGLDYGQDVTAPSIEVGRRQETPRRNMSLFEDDLGLDLGLGDTTVQDPTILADDGLDFGGGDIAMTDNSVFERNKKAIESAQRRERESLSPLSEIGDERAEDLERTFQLAQGDEQEEEEQDQPQIQAQQRAKRRRILVNDDNVEIGQSQIKAQQRDRSAILNQASLYPRDAFLNTLLNMSRNGQFVSQFLGDQPLVGMAPQLRGILSIEVVRRAGELKRKRTITPTQPAEEEVEEDSAPLPADDLPQLDEDEQEPFAEDESGHPMTPGGLNFDETTVAPVAPADSGPISLATKHTVHMLRERFAAEGQDLNEAPSPNTRQTQSALFTDLCPESTTTRFDATKLFFETLVLATKDAIKVEQRTEDGLGAPFRIRAKRGLWGAWAEMGVGQTEEDDEEGVAAVAGAGEAMQVIEV